MRYIERHREDVDVVLQFGATFDVSDSELPVILYCDGNVAIAEKGRAGGQSDAAFLRPDEIQGIWSREAKVYRNARKVLSISERLRRSFVEDFGLEDDRTRTVYAGPNFDTERIPYPTNHPKSGPPTMLFVGRDFQRKGGDVLLAAFRLVRARVPDARLLIVGPTDLHVDDPGVEVLGLLDKGTPEGWSALKAAYSTAHVFCMPTRYEGLSISFLEAMFFGLPCISTYTEWSQPEMIADGQTGVVVPVDDTNELARQATRLLEDQSEARVMGMAGRRRAENMFTWDAVAAKMTETFVEVVNPPAQ